MFGPDLLRGLIVSELNGSRIRENVCLLSFEVENPTGSHTTG